MDIHWEIKLIFLFVLLLIYAFLSAGEVALFSLDKRFIKTNLENNPLISRYLSQLLEYPRRLLVTILISSTLVSVAASIFAVEITIEIANSFNLNQDLLLTIQIIMLTILVVLFCELTPKVWAAKNPLMVTKFTAVPIYWLNVLFFPAAETLTEMIKFIVSKIKVDKVKNAILPEELSELANISHERGTLIEEEHGLIHSLVNFRSVAVHEVMTPRVDMISLSVDADLRDAIDLITSTGHSRIPLYQEDLDRIIGVIYAKDLLPYINNTKLALNFSLRKVARKTLFVPRTKMINEMMHEFQEKKMHIAIIVDEYGGTAGLITLEDIIEEIIGEIRDEYDKEEAEITKINNDTYLVLGKVSIDELKELLNIEIIVEENEFETLGGLVLSKAGSIPKEGFHFELSNYQFIVKEVLKKRIKKVLIERLPSE